MLSQEQKDFIALVLRSPDKGDGWRAVGEFLVPATIRMVDEKPELYETDSSGDKFMIRLSEEGKAVAKHL